MGSGSSKVPHKVVKVTPAPLAGVIPGRTDGESLQRGQPEETAQWWSSDRLPPLKKRLAAGCPAGALLPSLTSRQVPRAIACDINVDSRETSIIKNHPPRRYQRLEPTNGCSMNTSEKQQTENAHKLQAQEIQAEIAKQFSRRRQQIQKMRYEKIRQQEIIHLQDQAELMLNHHKEIQNNKQNIKYPRAKISRDKSQNNDHQEDQYFIAIESNDFFNAEYGKTPNKLERRQTQWDIFCYNSSDETLDCRMDTDQSSNRLIRTKTERTPIFDEFFDQEL
ncbi:factor associated with metabolism and energy-like [Rhinoraja longicauda]